MKISRFLRLATLSGLAYLFLFSFLSCEKKLDDRFRRAQADYEAERYIVVIDNLNLALHQWSNSPDKELVGRAYELLGKAYQKIRKYENAKEAFRQATQFSDHVYDASYELGLMHMVSRDYGKAKQAFSSALQIRKNDPLALLGLGDCFYLSGDYQEAREIYNRLLDLSPGVRIALKNMDLIDSKLEQSKRTYRHNVR